MDGWMDYRVAAHFGADGEDEGEDVEERNRRGYHEGDRHPPLSLSLSRFLRLGHSGN